MTLAVVLDDDTIIAQCTARGPAALALLRITGPAAFPCGDRIGLLACNKKITQCTSHTIEYGAVVAAEGAVIDRVLFFIMHAPRTFTGYDTLEITCHNNQAIIDAIIDSAISCGVRHAKAGEFSKRAFLTGKYDLLQAEAVNELIHAQTQQGLKQSLAQIEGTLSAFVVLLEKKLVKALALCEASFEFLDDEIEFKDSIFSLIGEVRDAIKGLIFSFYHQQRIRSGVRIALIGAVNAGKSSLFNAIIGHDRAIVSSVAGTTRDTIEALFCYKGITWTLIDTAGLRCTDNCIEQAGIERSYQEGALADIILLVYDTSCSITVQEQKIYSDFLANDRKKTIFIGTKSDQLLHSQEICQQLDFLVSAYKKDSIDFLVQGIACKVDALFSVLECPFLLNQRHHNLLQQLDNQLAVIEMNFKDTCPYELLSHHLTMAVADLAELTGKSINEASLDAVFREFCVGK